MPFYTISSICFYRYDSLKPRKNKQTTNQNIIIGFMNHLWMSHYYFYSSSKICFINTYIDHFIHFLFDNFLHSFLLPLIVSYLSFIIQLVPLSNLLSLWVFGIFVDELIQTSTILDLSSFLKWIEYVSGRSLILLEQVLSLQLWSHLIIMNIFLKCNSIVWICSEIRVSGLFRPHLRFFKRLQNLIFNVFPN